MAAGRDRTDVVVTLERSRYPPGMSEPPTAAGGAPRHTGSAADGPSSVDPRALAAALLRAPVGYAASLVSDAAEAALLVALAARRARPGVERPQILAPTTVHADVHRAAWLAGLELALVDVDRTTLRADPVAMGRAVTERTVLVVASAPTYPHGVLDPIRDIAEAAEDFDIPVHVDATCGGWGLAQLPGVGDWGFGVPGVSSVTLGARDEPAPTGRATALLYRSLPMRHGQFWAQVDWPGPSVVHPSPAADGAFAATPSGSDPTLVLGTAGYTAAARRAHAAAAEVASGVGGIPGLRVLAEPDAMVTVVAATGPADVYTVADEMRARGHAVSVQLPFRDLPASMRVAWTAASADPAVVLGDLSAAAALALASGPARPDPSLEAMLRGVDASTLVGDTVEAVLAAAGLEVGECGVRLPARMAPVYALLASAPVAVREALVVAVVERL